MKVKSSMGDYGCISTWGSFSIHGDVSVKGPLIIDGEVVGYDTISAQKYINVAGSMKVERYISADGSLVIHGRVAGYGAVVANGYVVVFVAVEGHGDVWGKQLVVGTGVRCIRRLGQLLRVRSALRLDLREWGCSAARLASYFQGCYVGRLVLPLRGG